MNNIYIKLHGRKKQGLKNGFILKKKPVDLYHNINWTNDNEKGKKIKQFGN